jgi:uncharacterized RDD family membrane protein YckC
VEQPVPSLRPAATSTRVGASLIDALISVSFGVVVAVLLLALGINDAFTVAFFLAGLAVIPYEIGLTAWIGQTIGKRAAKIVVVDASSRVPSRGRATVRYVVKALPGLTYLVGRAGAASLIVNLYPLALFASVATHAERRGWHDRVVGTWVMEEAGRRSSTQKLAEGVPQVPIIER